MMKRDADKRLLIKVASQDPEVAALVEGRHVENPIDSELYLLKKVRVFISNQATRVLIFSNINPDDVKCTYN